MSRPRPMQRRSARRTIAVLLAHSVLLGSCGDAPTREPANTWPAESVLATGVPTLALLPGSTGVVVVRLLNGARVEGTARLQADGLPRGVSATFDRGTLAGADSVDFLRIRVAADAATGDAPVQIVATAAAGQSTSRTLLIQIRARPLQLVLPATTTSVEQRRTVTIPVSLSRVAGFDGPVVLGLAGVPAGVAVHWSSQTLRADEGSATFTLAPGRDTPVGSYPLTVIASADAGVQATTTMALQVTASSVSEIALAIASPTLAVNVDSTARALVTVTRYGPAAGPVTLSLHDVPAGVAATLDRPVYDGTPSTLSFRASPEAPLGVHAITVRATSAGAADVSFPVTLRVLEPPSFRVSAPDSVVVAYTLPTFIRVATTRFGAYRYPIDVSLGGLPAGVTARSVFANSSEMQFNIDAAAGAAIAEYRVIVRATGPGGISDSAYVRVRVGPLLQYTLTMTPSLVIVPRGTTALVESHVDRPYYDVVIVPDSVPPGITVNYNWDAEPLFPVFNVTATPGATPGDHRVVFRGIREGLPDVLATLIVRVR